jgi:hypothetical protein
MMEWSRPISSGRNYSSGMAGIAVLLGVSCLALAGCQQQTQGGRPSAWTNLFQPRPPLAVTTAPADPPSAGEPAGLHEVPVAALVLSFDVLRTQVPRGTFSESGKVWNHIDEQVVPADQAFTLQLNGLRIGRGKMAAWAPIKALLDAEKDVTSLQNSMAVGNGLPLTIEVDAQPHDQTLFLFRPDGSLPGATLPGSMNLLRIEYAISVSDPNSVLLDVMPEVRLQPEDPARNPNAWMGRPVPPRTRVFRELAVQMLIGPDEFLAIGPSQAIRETHTIGALLLGREIDGRLYESMFFITPRVVRKTLSGARTEGAARPARTPAGR